MASSSGRLFCESNRTLLEVAFVCIRSATLLLARNLSFTGLAARDGFGESEFLFRGTCSALSGLGFFLATKL